MVPYCMARSLITKVMGITTTDGDDDDDDDDIRHVRRVRQES